MWNFNVSGNLVRLGDRFTKPTYRDYRATGFNEFVSDSTLLIGQPVTNFVTGICFSGPSSNTIITYNQFTTRPLTRFYRPDPGNTNFSVWKPIFKVPSGYKKLPYEYGPTILSSDRTELGSNFVSSVANDFRNFAATGDDGTYSPFTSTNAPGLTSDRAVLASATNFVLFGTVERVEMSHSNVTQEFSWLRRTLTYGTNGLPTATNAVMITNSFSNRILTKVREVQIGEPVLSTSNSVQIAVRLVDHFTPYAGGGSVYITNTVVRLSASGGHSVGPLSQTTDANGIATFTYSLGGVQDGVDELVAWWDGPGSLSTNLDFYLDSIATAKVTNGVVVSVVAGVEVAEDHDAGGTRQRGRFNFRRSGSLSNPLTVRYQVATNYDYPTFTVANNFWVWENNINAATSTMNAAATYGSSSGQDYTLSAVSPASRVAPSGYPFTGTLTFASGQAEAILEVVPKQDELTETNIVALWLLTTSTNTYALGPQTNATVYIYDGPEWTAYAVTDYTAPVRVTGVNNDSTPVISGTRYYSQYPYSGLDGGYWVAGFFNGFYRMATNFSYGNTPEPNGVSDTSGGAIRFAGYRNPGGGGVMQAWRGWQNNYYTLDPLTAGKAAEAKAVQTNAANTWMTVGWSDKTVSGSTVRRPVKWIGSSTTATDMGSLGSGTSELGEAWSVSRNGSTAGWSQYTSGGVTYTRAFATIEDDPLTGPLTDALQPPVGTVTPVYNDNTRDSAALYINDSGMVAGYWRDTSNPFNVIVRPAIWTPANGVANLNLISGDTQGDVTVITDAGRIFGRSSSSSPSAGKPCYWKYSWSLPVPLSDSHVFAGTSGWNLGRVNAANNTEMLAVDVKISGVDRGYVLVRRVNGN